jgi:hypothetical protein
LSVRRNADAKARATKFRREFLEIMAEFTVRGQKLAGKTLYQKYAASLPLLPQNEIFFAPRHFGERHSVSYPCLRFIVL